MKAFAEPITSLVIVDTKRVQSDWGSGFGIVSEEPEAILYHPRVVWRPRLSDILRPDPKGRDSFTRGLRYIYEQRGDPGFDQAKNHPAAVTVILDEGKTSAPVSGCNEWVDVLAVSGMGRGIGLWTLAQTVAGIRGQIPANAVHTIAGGLRRKLDRTVLAGNLGVDCEELRDLKEHEFKYFRDGSSGWVGPVVA